MRLWTLCAEPGAQDTFPDVADIKRSVCRSALVLLSQGFGRDGGTWHSGRLRHSVAAAGRPRLRRMRAACDDGLNDGVRAKLRGEATISLAVHLLLGRSHESIVRLLLNVDQIEVDRSEGRLQRR